MNDTHKQAKSAQRIIWRLQSRYSNRMDIVYLFVRTELIDTRSPHRKPVFQEWLEKHKEYSALSNEVLYGEMSKSGDGVNPAKVEKDERIEKLKSLIQEKGWNTVFKESEQTAQELGVSPITLYRYKQELSEEYETA